MKKHRMAIIGCGAMSQGTHFPNAQKNPRVDLVCACDINRSVAEQCCAKFGAQRAETDWRKVVDAKDIDMIVLGTQHNIRGEVIIPALRHGKPVYTEKPLAPSRKEMFDIVYASRETKVPVCVGHNRRSSPAILEFTRLLDKAWQTQTATPPAVDRPAERKHIAEEKQIQLLIRVNDDIRSWKGWIFRDEEGIFFAEMVHFIDLALLFNPSRPVRVFAEGSARGNFTMILRFADGSITTVFHTMVGHFDYPKELMEATVHNVTIAMDQHIEVRQCGLKGEPNLQTFPYAEGYNWATEQGMTGYFHEQDRERQRAEQAGEKPRWLNVNKGHYAHMDRFLDHIEGKGENPNDVESAVPVNLIALKLLESVRLGLPVAIGPEDWQIPE
ncbi:MAG: Gfo/Idh/MocA family oxidoreductase [Verrucomicrobia bacterium]|nr:Gfo/Idh/MocA family oxidoreductase [Verrucomicrobiota bacterium]MBU1734579.1 Gfo/Idh/MocA family oxidoreductase [Verrucomicrobiota bacterium]MBU1856232.1 Gfo/Idh/MocA family oxidoreductase [Verrucomicrobiota bacterium]